MSKINFIPCVYWIKRGVAKETPDKIELTKGDLKRLIEQAKHNIASNDGFVYYLLYFNSINIFIYFPIEMTKK